jgi:hypothetical protein
VSAVSDVMSLGEHFTPAVRLIGPLRRECRPVVTVRDLLTLRTPEAMARHIDDNV